MPQLSLYLPDKLMEQLKLRADREDASLSSFVTRLLERELEAAWPDAVTNLAGAWPDFPTRKDLPPWPPTRSANPRAYGEARAAGHTHRAARYLNCGYGAGGKSCGDEPECGAFRAGEGVGGH